MQQTHRIGGPGAKPGTGTLDTHKRVTALNNDTQHRAVPNALLVQLDAALANAYACPDATPASVLTQLSAARTALAPYLT